MIPINSNQIVYATNPVDTSVSDDSCVPCVDGIVCEEEATMDTVPIPTNLSVDSPGYTEDTLAPDAVGLKARVERDIMTEKATDAPETSKLARIMALLQELPGKCDIRAPTRCSRCQCTRQIHAALMQVDLGAVICCICGILMGIAILAIVDCWLGHTPYITSVVTVLMTLCSTVFLNTVEYDVIVNSQLHRPVIVLMVSCYGALFAQIGYVIWQLVQSSDDKQTHENCHSNCCSEVEAYYVLFMFGACTGLRFLEPLMRSRNLEAYVRLSVDSISHSSSIIIAVLAIGFVVASIVLQIFATFGKFGDSTGLLIQFPCVVLLPLVVIVRAAVGLTRSWVWTNWSCCLPPVAYILCIGWPLALFHRDYIRLSQTVLGLCANLCAVAASRLLTMVMSESASSPAQCHSALDLIM